MRLKLESNFRGLAQNGWQALVSEAIILVSTYGLMMLVRIGLVQKRKMDLLSGMEIGTDLETAGYKNLID
jgi:hypothetical protein